MTLVLGRISIPILPGNVGSWLSAATSALSVNGRWQVDGREDSERAGRQQWVENRLRCAPNISNCATELISESPGNMLVEFCKGDTPIFHNTIPEPDPGLEFDQRVSW